MWKAEFIDGSILEEFDKFGKEVPFSKVMDRVNELKTFSIVLASSKIFTIRFRDGRFTVTIDGKDSHFYGFDIEKYDVTKLTNIRPIYFVRETVNFQINAGPGVHAGTLPRVNFTALGFQANYNGKNLKRYLAIYPDGKYIIRDE